MTPRTSAFASMSVLVAIFVAALVSLVGTHSPPEPPQQQQLSQEPQPPPASQPQAPASSASSASSAYAAAPNAAVPNADSSQQPRAAAQARRRPAPASASRARGPSQPHQHPPSAASRALIEQLGESLDLSVPSASRPQDRASAPEFLLELYTAVANETTGRTRQATPFEADAIHGIPENGESHGAYFWFDVSGIERDARLLEAELHVYRLPPQSAAAREALGALDFIHIHVLQLLEPAGFSNASTIANSALSTDGSLGASPPAADGSSAGTGEQTSSGPGRRVRHVKTHRVWANGSGWEPIPVKELVAGWLSGRERNYGVYLLACDAAGRALSAAVLHIQHARDLPQAEVRRRRRSAEPARGGSKKPCLVLFTESARHQREAAEHAALYSKPDHFYDLKNKYVSSNELRVLDVYKAGGSLEEAIRLLNEKERDEYFGPTAPAPAAPEGRGRFRRTANAVEQREATQANVSLPRAGLGGQQRQGNWYARPVVRQVGCRLFHMHVDFKAIGWNHWILKPDGFDAYRCAGHCEFPIGRHLNPTNHAIIQAIMHALQEDGAIPGVADVVPGYSVARPRQPRQQRRPLRLRDYVDGPCCVPDRMGPIALLYFDDHHFATLKTYDNMVAQSCACR